MQRSRSRSRSRSPSRQFSGLEHDPQRQRHRQDYINYILRQIELNKLGGDTVGHYKMDWIPFAKNPDPEIARLLQLQDQAEMELLARQKLERKQYQISELEQKIAKLEKECKMIEKYRQDLKALRQ